ncbi:hypothetical protein PVAP13_5KG760500 [Panicum virgatum]|uniref:Uncharacterized protein n=1 Tax=Panicum virgatum TaxID=38727 RepID=A0A8T0T207_PANVG|nr:hypothetical protein PVAP13_5KG760500 [Panicum virgatum]
MPVRRPLLAAAAVRVSCVSSSPSVPPCSPVCSSPEGNNGERWEPASGDRPSTDPSKFICPRPSGSLLQQQQGPRYYLFFSSKKDGHKVNIYILSMEIYHRANK